MSIDSKGDCARSTSTIPIARSTSRGAERNVGRRLACSLALAALGVLVASETAFAQAQISNIGTPDKDLENLAGKPQLSGIRSDGETARVVGAHGPIAAARGTYPAVGTCTEVQSCAVLDEHEIAQAFFGARARRSRSIGRVA